MAVGALTVVFANQRVYASTVCDTAFALNVAKAELEYANKA